MAVNGVTGSSTTSASSTARSTIAQNFDTFLSILTTQLRNQNPLDPLDTNQFTQQLVQFTGVEQQLKTNDFLEALLANTQNQGRVDAVSYIGKEVTASGKTGELKEGGAMWTYNAASPVANATVTIKNATGSVVYVEQGSLNAGVGNFLWTGAGSDGNKQPDGVYTIEITGTNVSGNAISISTSSVGVVTAVDFSGAEPVLTVGRNKVALKDVTSVRSTGQVTTPPPATGS
ncbi:MULTISPECIES: flagellar hook assembly protein FlgD [unclassified Devosia]|uniref:flagellar hook assembly protein FlgD n=1 Tax=unclassified Devosia TaxID=196773 RepID=UPI0015F93183|nr:MULTISPECIES: flagellar hook assembly protein FlgD [unclassified Devosia]MBJ6988638.1 flagellar hook assembly protein FlgD [Devosia sp. MC521]MBJ7578270.1 flagellar hook assembly protein FlgD [Devosia sp. MC532]MBK1794798.1 flagellar hook assembly protein FlgD [Devosia sp. WQ 349K1]QMW62137.1 flagellar hook assembly protein FlgD [Devosia sp. MC521]